MEQAHVSTGALERARESIMPARRHASQILVVEIIGFLAIIALSWANELYGLPSLIFGGGHRVNWPESLLETAIIALVNAGSEWIPVEEFFEQRFDTQTSHGMCPPCLAEQKGKLRRAS